MMERYRSDSVMIGMKEIVSVADDIPSCMMISEDLIIRGMGGGYDNDEREAIEDKISEGFDSLL